MSETERSKLNAAATNNNKKYTTTNISFPKKSNRVTLPLALGHTDIYRHGTNTDTLKYYSPIHNPLMLITFSLHPHHSYKILWHKIWDKIIWLSQGIFQGRYSPLVAEGLNLIFWYNFMVWPALQACLPGKLAGEEYYHNRGPAR